jgi:hypothetical protein
MRKHISSSEWLASLPEFACTKCGKMSIFRGLCSRCDELEMKREDLDHLNNRLYSTLMEIDSYLKEATKIKTSIKETEEWLSKNDPEYRKIV